ncbi:hypothetical protein INR49_031689 [Caranx melampygus]|nr:hypothetical protein INR49_031689 [Caranx melampygus]
MTMMMWTSTVMLVLLVAVSHTAAKPRNRFTRYPSWNSKMYPVWKDGDPRYKDSWKGGRVTFHVGNDSPTLTGAKVTFTIDLEYPHNQRVTPDGDVYHESEPVYPAQSTDWEAVFPDGTPIKKDKKPSYVFVWKTWGQYWQVADGPSSSLTIGTDDIPLGSYTMDIVIYHYRSKEKFIPLGYATNQFSITDQIPFAVSLDQVNDVVAGDMRFIQNRAIAFTIALHDPSEYLSNADITFNWDFGDESGALISRELTVTHTYISSGSFRPQVVIQAVIPDKACDPPVETPTKGPHTDQGTTVKAPALASALPHLISTKSTGLTVNMVPSDTEEDNTEDEASTASTTQPAQETPTVTRTPSPVNQARPADRETAEGIETVKIVQMDNAVVDTPHTDKNVVDITVTCQGSQPKEVCSVILDAECLRPIHTSCNMVEPSKECQLVLRHFFNDSGVYCINVSMANDVSLAVTSAKLNLEGPSVSSSGTIAMLLGVVVLVLAAGIVAYSYKRFKSYRPLKEDMVVSGDQHLGRAQSCSGSSIFWNLLNRRGAVDNCPLLQDRPSCHVLSGLRELSLLHTLTHVPVNKGTLSVHQVKLVVEPSPGLCNSSGVAQHAHGPLDLGQVSTRNHGGRLVVDADLETSGAPVHKLDGALGFNGGDGGIDIFGHHITTEQQAAGHVFTVARVTFDHLIGRLEAGVCDLSHRQLLVINIEGTIETEGSSDGGHDLTDQPVQVGVGRTLDIEVPTADIIDGLIIYHEGTVRVLQGGVGGQDGVVGLHHSGGHLGSWVDGELQLGLLAVVHGQTLHQQGGETRAGATSEAVEDQEALKTGALFADPVQNQVNDLFADGVVSTGVVVGSILLTSDQLLGVEQLAVDEHGSGDVFSSSSLTEEGVEGIISSSQSLVAGHLSVRLDPMFQAVKLPAGIADLDTSLANVDGDTLTLWERQKTEVPLMTLNEEFLL